MTASVLRSARAQIPNNGTGVLVTKAKLAADPPVINVASGCVTRAVTEMMRLLIRRPEVLVMVTAVVPVQEKVTATIVGVLVLVLVLVVVLVLVSATVVIVVIIMVVVLAV